MPIASFFYILCCMSFTYSATAVCCFAKTYVYCYTEEIY